jgi:hypothetical protein
MSIGTLLPEALRMFPDTAEVAAARAMAMTAKATITSNRVKPFEHLLLLNKFLDIILMTKLNANLNTNVPFTGPG